jgi:prephenate dehydrogenase
MNRDEVLPALRALEEPLGELERALETADAVTLTRWLARAAEWRRKADV